MDGPHTGKSGSDLRRASAFALRRFGGSLYRCPLSRAFWTVVALFDGLVELLTGGGRKH